MWNGCWEDFALSKVKWGENGLNRWRLHFNQINQQQHLFPITEGKGILISSQWRVPKWVHTGKKGARCCYGLFHWRRRPHTSTPNLILKLKPAILNTFEGLFKKERAKEKSVVLPWAPPLDVAAVAYVNTQSWSWNRNQPRCQSLVWPLISKSRLHPLEEAGDINQRRIQSWIWNLLQYQSYYCIGGVYHWKGV